MSPPESVAAVDAGRSRAAVTAPAEVDPSATLASSSTAPGATAVPKAAAATTLPSTTVPSTAVPSTAVPPSTDSTVAPAAATPSVEFASSIAEIDGATAARMTHSWRPGCPVGLEDLRLLTLTHWNYAGTTSTGELVVHRDHAEALVGVFATLYEIGFPIERMELVDNYGGDDDDSMAANNTSAFNCREVAWKPGVWSNHAFGTAVDINPLVNPYVKGSTVLPPGGAPFVDRSVPAMGGVYPGDDVVAAFASIGWGWGGDWSSAKDWQHFSASGT